MSYGAGGNSCLDVSSNRLSIRSDFGHRVRRRRGHHRCDCWRDRRCGGRQVGLTRRVASAFWRLAPKCELARTTCRSVEVVRFINNSNNADPTVGTKACVPQFLVSCLGSHSRFSSTSAALLSKPLIRMRIAEGLLGGRFLSARPAPSSIASVDTNLAGNRPAIASEFGASAWLPC